MLVFAKHHRADKIALQIKRQPETALVKRQHLALLRRRKPVNAHNAIADRKHRAFVAQVRIQVYIAYFAADDIADFRRTQLLHCYFSCFKVAFTPSSAAIVFNRPRMLASKTSSRA